MDAACNIFMIVRFTSLANSDLAMLSRAVYDICQHNLNHLKQSESLYELGLCLTEILEIRERTYLLLVLAGKGILSTPNLEDPEL